MFYEGKVRDQNGRVFFYEGNLQPGMTPVTNTELAKPDSTMNAVLVDQKKNTFNIQMSVYGQNGGFVEANCNAITFYNSNDPLVGGANVNVNGVILKPGNALIIEGNIGEVDTTRYQIIFFGSNLGNATPQCQVIRKIDNV